MKTPISSVPTSAAVAARLERAARILAPLLCLTIAAALTLAELAWQCGYQLGTALHQRNDELAALWRRVCRIPGPAPAPLVPAPAPLVPALHPLAVLAESLEALTVVELRRITGTRRRCRKAELVGLALAMA